MENEKLFRVCANGYNCEQVDEYIKLLKAEYRKLYDFAESSDDKIGVLAQQKAEISSDNMKLKDAAVALEAEKAMLQKRLEESERKLRMVVANAETQRTKAADTVTPAPTGDYEVLSKSLSTMTMLSEEIVRENRELRRRLSVYETI